MAKIGTETKPNRIHLETAHLFIFDLVTAESSSYEVIIFSTLAAAS